MPAFLTLIRTALPKLLAYFGAYSLGSGSSSGGSSNPADKTQQYFIWGAVGFLLLLILKK
jgi:hypothetical protein